MGQGPAASRGHCRSIGDFAQALPQMIFFLFLHSWALPRLFLNLSHSRKVWTGVRFEKDCGHGRIAGDAETSVTLHHYFHDVFSPPSNIVESMFAVGEALSNQIKLQRLLHKGRSVG